MPTPASGQRMYTFSRPICAYDQNETEQCRKAFLNRNVKNSVETQGKKKLYTCSSGKYF